MAPHNLGKDWPPTVLIEDMTSGEESNIRCRSWSGSPMLPCSSKSLPFNTTLVDHERNRSLYRLTRSPATEQLSNHAKQTYFTMPPLSNNQSHPQGYRYRPNLPSCKPTDIQHEFPANIVTQPTCNQRIVHTMSDSPRLAHRVNFSLANCQNKVEEGTNQLIGRRSVSPARSPEMACKLVEEATKLSIYMGASRTPSPTPLSSDTVRPDSPMLGHHSREAQLDDSFLGSGGKTHSDGNPPVPKHNWKQESIKTTLHSCQTLLPHIGSTSPVAPARLHCLDVISPSPIQDPRIERTQLGVNDSPTMHRHQPPQNTRYNYTSGNEDRQFETPYNRGLKDRPDISRRTFTRHNTETPLSWTSQQMHRREECSARENENIREVENHKRKSPVIQGCQDNNFWVSVDHNEIKCENRANREWSGTASKSSSGVMVSLLESTLQKIDFTSSETSSKTSQKSSDSGNTGIQSESGLRPSLHSQKTARAKWEFLFGTHSEDQHDSKGSSSGCSSESPASNQPSSTSLTAHDVQHVEVELINHAPAMGSSPKKTCSIKQTVKYSETDIDAVPLCCYRETDLDEVILAEQEEVDSAFGSNRSVLGTSGTSSSSPLEGDLCPHSDGEEELQDEEVVSWASVRMQGDKKRQNAAPEWDEVFSRLLRGPPDSQPDSQTALKSPISVTSPCRTSSDGLDSFSRHFESIMESHRAKGTSYSSLDSEDITPSGTPVFTFDFPTLTPEIQSKICESAKQIIELSFATLACPESPTVPDPKERATSQASLYEEESKSCSGSCSDKAHWPDSDADAVIRHCKHL
ncbi:uncharacterized protein LOC127660340 [Xyrauchen texanus]|uniref:uncharacterized protein LOC127660340 n=1 Tax=Xyrauchen texanus TaxID=154827 RepID=UPI0022421452|nr:uncharacterized protein LOC127660340 [Xyrauchen texanus]